MELDTEKKKTLQQYVEEGTEMVKDILDTVEQGIGIAASPAVLWLNIIFGQGFDGHVTNPTFTPAQTAAAIAAATGITPPPANPPPPIITGGVTSGSSLVGTYKGWNIYLNADGMYQGVLPSIPQGPTPEEKTVQAVKNDIDGT